MNKYNQVWHIRNNAAANFTNSVFGNRIKFNKISNNSFAFASETFSNVKIGLTEIYDEAQNLIPFDWDSPFVIVPKGEICFGNKEPCSCQLREFFLKLKSANVGLYTVKIKQLTYSVEYILNDEFILNV